MDAEGLAATQDRPLPPGEAQYYDQGKYYSPPVSSTNPLMSLPQYSTLHIATRAGAVERVARILTKGECDIDTQDEFGRTPLMHAIHYGELQCAALLLRQGADTDVQDYEGSTCLHDACFDGGLDTVNALLSSGANHVGDKYLRTGSSLSHLTPARTHTYT